MDPVDALTQQLGKNSDELQRNTLLTAVLNERITALMGLPSRVSALEQTKWKLVGVTSLCSGLLASGLVGVFVAAMMHQ